MKHLFIAIALLCTGVDPAFAQTAAGVPLGSTELSTPGLSPGGALPLPGTQFGSSAMAATEYGSSLTIPGTSSSSGLSQSAPVNHLITNYGTGGMQLPPGAAPLSNR